MLLDAFNGVFDTAVVVSNDSDLTTPIEMLVNELRKKVIVINPSPPKFQSKELRGASSGALNTINQSVLVASQFEKTMTDSRGTFSRPPSWA